MRIIRVNSCADCPNCKESIGEIMKCYYNEDSHTELGDITKHYLNKTLPDTVNGTGNCPLEKDRVKHEIKSFAGKDW